MMPKASLNCWMAEWEKESKMLAFLGMVVLVVAPVGPETRSKLVKLVNKVLLHQHCTLAALIE